jgi:hypothetical protein
MHHKLRIAQYGRHPALRRYFENKAVSGNGNYPQSERMGAD